MFGSGEGEKMPREVKLGTMIGIVCSVIASMVTGFVTAVSVSWSMAREFERLTVKQGYIMIQIEEIKENDRQRSSQVAAMATNLNESLAAVQMAQAAAVNFHNDMRNIAEDLREQSKWSRERIVELQREHR